MSEEISYIKSGLIKAEKRNKTIYDKRYGIIKNGIDNCYPTMIERLINSSPTAKQAAGVYAKFVRGQGFNVDLSNVKIGRSFNKMVTPLHLLRLVARDLAYQNGVFVHLAYNLNCEVTQITHLPFGQCRFGEQDSQEYSGKIRVYNNWDLEIKRKIYESEIKTIDVYNPNKEVIKKQIEAAGGIKNYKGQVYFLFLDDIGIYPLSKLDVAKNDALIEYYSSAYKLGIIKNDFITDKHIIQHGKFETEKDLKDFKENLRNIKGAENAGNHMTLQDKFNESTPDGNLRVTTLTSGLKPNAFESWENRAANNIRKQFNNVPTILIDEVEGKLGNSSAEAISQQIDFYNLQTLEDRQEVEMMFKEIFSNFHKEVNPQNDWSIKQFEYFDNSSKETSQTPAPGNNQPVKESTEEEKLQRQAQANLRGSVGGVTSALQIQASVSQRITTYDSGISMLKIFYGYTQEEAEAILGTPQETAPEGDKINN